MRIFYTCLNEDCKHEFDMEVSEIVPAQTYGPPENCYPAEGGEIDVESCPKCNQAISEEHAYELASEAAEAARDAWLESKED